MISHKRLLELCEYDSGRLILKQNIRKRFKVGHVLGCMCSTNGYRQIKLFGILYREHNLIWFYHRGKWPKNELDHKKRIRTLNVIENLREATHQQNLWNKGLISTNTSGITGVRKINRPLKKQWFATITCNKKTYSLGYFKTKQEAEIIRRYKEKELFGEYANL